MPRVGVIPLWRRADFRLVPLLKSRPETTLDGAAKSSILGADQSGVLESRAVQVHRAGKSHWCLATLLVMASPVGR